MDEGEKMRLVAIREVLQRREHKRYFISLVPTCPEYRVKKLVHKKWRELGMCAKCWKTKGDKNA